MGKRQTWCWNLVLPDSYVLGSCVLANMHWPTYGYIYVGHGAGSWREIH